MSVTAGLKFAPEMGLNARISTTGAAPVAVVLARSARATLSSGEPFGHDGGADYGGNQKSGAKKFRSRTASKSESHWWPM
jgi:hypothetical protein